MAEGPRLEYIALWVKTYSKKGVHLSPNKMGRRLKPSAHN